MTPSPPFQSKRVLLVDDISETRDLLRVYLAEAPFEVVFGFDGVNGMKHYEAAKRTGRPFDLVITDVMMPESSGLQLGEKIRATGDQTTPIVLLTAYDLDLIGATRLSMVGVLDLWPKPTALLDLKERICAVLGIELTEKEKNS